MRCAWSVGCTKRMRKSSGGGFAVHEPQLDRLHATAPLAQKSTKLVEQRCDGESEAAEIGDLGLEVAMDRELSRCTICRTRIGQPSDCTIEHREHLWLEPTRKTVTRQTQAIADRAHTHRRERCDVAFGPPSGLRKR
jgi:ATP-dependent helicase YprA (DUF1998 family)